MSDIDQILKELLDDLVPTMTAADTRSATILQLLKDKGIVSDDELAPYLEQAANASNVKERAARLRFEHLFATAIKSLQQAAQETATKVLEQKEEEVKQSKAETKPQKKEDDQPRDASESRSQQPNAPQNPAGDKPENEKPVPDTASEHKAA